MTLYIAQAPGADAAGLEKTRIVKDGFSWPAFLFGPLWLLYHRVWLLLAVWIAVEVAFIFIATPHVSPTASAAVDLLAHLWLGFEGNRLRLRNPAIEDVIEARSKDEAEVVFFRRQLGETGASPT